MTEEPTKNGGLTGKDPKTGRFLEGNKLGLGRPPGIKNFTTLFEEAVKKIIQEKKIPIEDPEVEMATKAIIEAMEGNYPFWHDLMDRVYGKAPEQINLKHSIAENLVDLIKNATDTNNKTAGGEISGEGEE